MMKYCNKFADIAKRGCIAGHFDNIFKKPEMSDEAAKAEVLEMLKPENVKEYNKLVKDIEKNFNF